MIVKGGSTNVVAYFQMRLTAGGDGTGLTIADFDLTYTRSGDTPAAKADAVALAAANTAHTDNRGIEVDPTDAPGLYRFDFPDAAFAASVREVILTVKHADCFTESLRVEIVSYDSTDGVRLGLTALPNAAADAAGGLPISDAGGLDLDVKLANTNEVTVARMGALTDWIDGGRLDLILDARASQASVDTIDSEVGDVDTVVDAIKVQTDKLTFTVANQIGANIQAVNDVTLTGTGVATTDEWRPA